MRLADGITVLNASSDLLPLSLLHALQDKQRFLTLLFLETDLGIMWSISIGASNSECPQ